VLAYGSNACPEKIEWFRHELGLAGPVVAFEADVSDAAAAWAAGIRFRDDQRPAVLTGFPGVHERHVVWLATPEQRSVLDEVEGRNQRYRLAWVHTPATLGNGQTFEWVLAYIARPEIIGKGVEIKLNRLPLLVETMCSASPT